MSKEEALELDSRRAIFKAIESNPGIHFRELKRKMDYSVGTLQYHVRYLKEARLIEEEAGDYTRYYPRREFREVEKKVLDALRRKYTRRALIYLLTYPGSTHGDLVEALGKAPSTISWHLNKLKEEDLLDEKREGGKTGYYVKEPDKLKALYITYSKSFVDKLVDNMVDLWDI